VDSGPELEGHVILTCHMLHQLGFPVSLPTFIQNPIHHQHVLITRKSMSSLPNTT
jgi:hypothetical protein